jgi:hypothetical protein
MLARALIPARRSLTPFVYLVLLLCVAARVLWLQAAEGLAWHEERVWRCRALRCPSSCAWVATRARACVGPCLQRAVRGAEGGRGGARVEGRRVRLLHWLAALTEHSA